MANQLRSAAAGMAAKHGLSLSSSEEEQEEEANGNGDGGAALRGPAPATPAVGARRGGDARAMKRKLLMTSSNSADQRRQENAAKKQRLAGVAGQKRKASAWVPGAPETKKTKKGAFLHAVIQRLAALAGDSDPGKLVSLSRLPPAGSGPAAKEAASQLIAESYATPGADPTELSRAHDMFNNGQLKTQRAAELGAQASSKLDTLAVMIKHGRGAGDIQQIREHGGRQVSPPPPPTANSRGGEWGP